MALDDIRKTYQHGSLDEQAFNPDPIKQFQVWLDETLKTDLLEPTAMSLATSSKSGRPSCRMVLLKGIVQGGFIFYSNYQSRKGQDLAENPYAALSFYWDILERQVRIEGEVSKLSREDSASYFASRPHNSQVAALASKQSKVIANKKELKATFDQVAANHPKHVPLPEHWGGYKLVPDQLEFWQGRPHRLHDRLRYRKHKDTWILERLLP